MNRYFCLSGACVTVIAIALVGIQPVMAIPWNISFGLDMSHLTWEHGAGWAWGFQGAFGLEVLPDVYLRAKITIPTPFFVVIGNQVCLGGEISWEALGAEGLSLETSLGAAWSLHWPQHVVVILADGPGPGEPTAFDHAAGIRYEALVSPGFRFGDGAVWLDLGYDLRRMNVLWFDENERLEGIRIFSGPHIGFSADYYF